MKGKALQIRSWGAQEFVAQGDVRGYRLGVRGRRMLE